MYLSCMHLDSCAVIYFNSISLLSMYFFQLLNKLAMSFQFSGLYTMSSFWQPRNTWEKSRPLIQSGWSSLPRNFSASATPRNSASKRNSRKSSLCTTNTRIQTHGESRELSRNFTQKLPSEEIIVLFFFLNISHVFVHVGTCIHFKGVFTLIQMMVNESCSSSRDLCLQPWVQLCMYYNASWSKLVHVLSPVGTIVYDGHLIWDLSTHAIPIHLLMILYESFEKWKCFYMY